MVEVPVIGKITAGEPILAVENVTDTFPIPLDFVGNCESFMLTVRGESMIDRVILKENAKKIVTYDKLEINIENYELMVKGKVMNKRKDNNK